MASLAGFTGAASARKAEILDAPAALLRQGWGIRGRFSSALVVLGLGLALRRLDETQRLARTTRQRV